MNEFECSNDNGCDWVENIEYGNCNNLGSSSCDANPNCWGAYTNPGWYYGWYCAGGTYQIDNSYCEEVSFIPGDVNSDGYLNIMDVVMIMDFILTEEYDMYSDMNQDGILNIMDIIELVNMILEG